jgi:hypothetical protein
MKEIVEKESFWRYSTPWSEQRNSFFMILIKKKYIERALVNSFMQASHAELFYLAMQINKWSLAQLALINEYAPATSHFIYCIFCKFAKFMPTRSYSLALDDRQL